MQQGPRVDADDELHHEMAVHLRGEIVELLARAEDLARRLRPSTVPGASSTVDRTSDDPLAAVVGLLHDAHLSAADLVGRLDEAHRRIQQLVNLS